MAKGEVAQVAADDVHGDCGARDGGVFIDVVKGGGCDKSACNACDEVKGVVVLDFFNVVVSAPNALLVKSHACGLEGGVYKPCAVVVTVR